MLDAKATGLLAGVVLAGVALLGSFARATPGRDIIRNERGCSGLTLNTKMIRCMACIRRGGHFHKQGGESGYCHIRPEQGVIHTKAGCIARLASREKRRSCLGCIGRGGLFHLMGVEEGYCNPRRRSPTADPPDPEG
jgi:hypothetical protein